MEAESNCAPIAICKDHEVALQSFDLSKEPIGFHKYNSLVVHYCPALLCSLYFYDKFPRLMRETDARSQKPCDDFTLNAVTQLHILKKQIAHTMMSDGK